MSDLLREVLEEIAARPLAFTAEAVQSLLLILLLTWAARRYGARLLADRRSRIAADLADAEAAERDSARIREEAPLVVAKGTESAAEILRSAREQAAKAQEASTAAIEDEARQIVEQARTTAKREESAIRRSASDRLVALTTEAARMYLDEMLTEADRRALTQRAILAFLEEAESPATPVESGAG